MVPVSHPPPSFLLSFRMILFNFPASITASILGAALIVPSKSQVTADINAAKEPARPRSIRGANLKGAECSLVDSSFKVDATTEDTDVGVLGCYDGEVCVADSASSLGGLCIDIELSKELADKNNDELVAVDSHRELVGTSCVYDDNSAGTKCAGTGACANINMNLVKCGSCNGENACASAAGRELHVSGKSCIGDNACRAYGSTQTVYISDDSCIGSNACLKG
jgi:hypothetical protein